jgi:hypothetical protein
MPMPQRASVLSVLLCLICLISVWAEPVAADPTHSTLANPSEASENPVNFVEFILEDEANCQSRESQHVIVHNIHPKRIIRVWLDRYYRSVPTGDRSRTDLIPGGEPEGLGCATVMNAKQEWRVVKAIFVD